MSQITKIVTITAKVSPYVCGVGDYTINLSTQSKTYLNLDIEIIVEKGCVAVFEPVKIV